MIELKSYWKHYLGGIYQVEDLVYCVEDDRCHVVYRGDRGKFTRSIDNFLATVNDCKRFTKLTPDEVSKHLESLAPKTSTTDTPPSDPVEPLGEQEYYTVLRDYFQNKQVVTIQIPSISPEIEAYLSGGEVDLTKDSVSCQLPNGKKQLIPAGIIFKSYDKALEFAIAYGAMSGLQVIPKPIK